jgi:hypothetical protein
MNEFLVGFSAIQISQFDGDSDRAEKKECMAGEKADS